MSFSKLILLSTFSVSALAAVTSTTTISNIFLPHPTDSFVGSVVGAGNFLTTIAVECTAGGLGCGDDLAATVTWGSELYQVSAKTVIDGVTASFAESCSIGGTTIAVCAETISGKANGQTVSTTTTGTLLGTDIPFGQIVITAGAEKLASATITSKNAAPTGGLSGVLMGGAALVAGALL